jgi:5-methylcytosine-specific restriction enzyme B
MARLTKSRSLEPVINAAQEWVRNCLIGDRSVFSADALWTQENVAEVHRAFVEHPDEGDDNFLTKLKGQMEPASASAKRLMAEMAWALLLFPSNIKVSTKRQQVSDIWSMSGEQIDAAGRKSGSSIKTSHCGFVRFTPGAPADNTPRCCHVQHEFQSG